MQTKFLEDVEKYDGSQLRSLYAYEVASLKGDAAVAWVGPCDVDTGKIVDFEDLKDDQQIKGSNMVHFIVELFHQDIVTAASFQRLMMASAMHLLSLSLDDKSKLGLSRSGDDLYFKEGKLSISIATVSPLSGLIHLALNISNEGTPVKTSSLEDLGVDPEGFARELLNSIQQEWMGIQWASKKVKWVK